MSKIVEELLKLPNIKLVDEELHELLAAEHKRRLQFYEDITEQMKAEFINGEVIIHSPVKLDHNVITKRMVVLMVLHVELYQLGMVGYEKLMVSLTRNDYEPDVCFFTTDQKIKFTSNQMHFPAPIFITEVLSPSTERNDRGIKYEDYAAHGVLEYWIIDPTTKHIEQYVLDGKIYKLRFDDCMGIVESVAIPGFDVNTELLFNDDAFLAFIEKDKKENVRLNKIIAEVERMMSEKDNLLAENVRQLANKDRLLADKDSLLANKDSLLADKDSLLAEKENLLAEKDNQLAETAKQLAEKEQLIAELYAKLK